MEDTHEKTKNFSNVFNFLLVFVIFICTNDFYAHGFAPMGNKRFLKHNIQNLGLSSNEDLDLSGILTKTNDKNDLLDCQILSEDPKVYLVSNLLTSQECEAYINRANEITKHADETNEDTRGMARSNPPEVSIHVTKLWPLPFLCLGAGIPPIIRLFEGSSSYTESSPSINMEHILAVASPPIKIAIGVAIALTILMQQIIRQISKDYSRTSEAVALNTEGDCEFIRNLVERASAITDNRLWSSWEAPVVTRYEPGAIFASHNDASPTRGSEWADQGGQRIVTVITYLNTCQEGGGTKFDQLGFTVQPKQGSALVFFPADSKSLDADNRTVHQSLPALEEKWIVQLFGRVGRVPAPLGIPDCFDSL